MKGKNRKGGGSRDFGYISIRHEGTGSALTTFLNRTEETENLPASQETQRRSRSLSPRRAKKGGGNRGPASSLRLNSSRESGRGKRAADRIFIGGDRGKRGGKKERSGPLPLEMTKWPPSEG